MPRRNDHGIHGDVTLFEKPVRKRRTVQRQTETDSQIKDVGRRLGIVPPPPPQPAPRPPSPPQEENCENIENTHYLQDLQLPSLPSAPIIDPNCEDFYLRHKRYNAIEKRQKISQKWKSIQTQLTVVFLERQHHTLNWTSLLSYLNEHPANCSCTQTIIREVDLIDLSARRRKEIVRFCLCMPDPVRLLHYGYFAGSPDHPSTAFSIPLIQFYQALWKQTVLSSSAFLDGTMAFLDSRSNQYLSPRTCNYINHNIKRQFTQAVDLYRMILLQQQKTYKDGLNLTPSQLLSDQCPRCFGSAIGEVKASPGEVDIIIAMDGNFQHRHHSKASTDNPEDNEYPSLFIPPSHIKIHERTLKETAGQAAGLKTPCSESHTAADDVRNSSSCDQCDDTGLFGSVCRHDVPLRFVNIYKSGEKLFYPISILQDILESLPDKRLGVLYDIGCHLDAHIKKRGLLPKYKEKLIFATSVFHAYAHRWPCQIMYNPLFIQFFGLSDGEGLERQWSFLSDLVAINRISTRLHRLLMINSRAEFYGEDLTAGSAKWLLKKYLNAVEVFSLSKGALNQLFSLENPATGQKYSTSFFEEQWKSEREAQGSKSHHMDQLRLKLGNLLCLRDKLQKLWKSNTFNAEQEMARIQSVISLNKQILEASKKVGRAGDTGFANKTHQEIMLKLWSSKHELRMKFISVCEEKKPLQISRTDGRHSNLGVKQKSVVMNAVRKHALALKSSLEDYITHLGNYCGIYPTDIVPDPASMDYARLLRLEADSPFWNDGFITHTHEPWAVDPNTQHGMRQLAYNQRSREEMRRIGWEIRRAMRWATERHETLWKLLQELREPLFEPTSSQSQSLLTSLASKTAVTAIIHNKILQVFNLQELWNDNLMKIVHRTDSQDGDEELLQVWKTQVAWIFSMRSKGELSLIPGNFGCLPHRPPPQFPVVLEEERIPSGDDSSDNGVKLGDNDDEENIILGTLNEEDVMTALANVLSMSEDEIQETLEVSDPFHA